MIQRACYGQSWTKMKMCILFVHFNTTSPSYMTVEAGKTLNVLNPKIIRLTCSARAFRRVNGS